MSTSEGVLWSIPAMQQAFEDIVSVQGNLTSTYEEMNAQLAPMAEIWQGRGSESYGAVQQSWNKAMEDMLAVLRQISSALQQSIDIHTTVEGQITNAWEQ
jgi:6 kDa early secretory antigenic target